MSIFRYFSAGTPCDIAILDFVSWNTTHKIPKKAATEDYSPTPTQTSKKLPMLLSLKRHIQYCRVSLFNLPTQICQMRQQHYRKLHELGETHHVRSFFSAPRGMSTASRCVVKLSHTDWYSKEPSHTNRKARTQCGNCFATVGCC